MRDRSQNHPDELRREDQRLQTDSNEVVAGIFAAFPGGIVHVSRDGAILNANREALQLLGYAYDEISKRYTVDWSPETIHRDGSPCPAEEYPVTLTLQTQKPYGPMTIGVRRPDGSLAWAVFRSTPLFSADGSTMTGAIVTFLEITGEIEYLETIKHREEDLKNLLYHIPHYVTNYTPEGTIVFVNRVASDVNPEDVLNKSIFDFHPPEEHAALRDRIERIIQTGISEEYESDIHLNERTIRVHNVLWTFEQHGQRLMGVISTDISDLHEMNQRLLYQATHDSLTGLVNRYHFEKLVEEAIESARSENRGHALLYADLDQFKVVNDTCGHMAGDALLKRLAMQLTRDLPESTIISRLGGDEFGILFYDLDLPEAITRAEAMLSAISSFSFPWDGRVFRIGASLGIVRIDAGCESYTQLLKDADVACYTAKETGRNQLHIFNPDDERTTRRKREMLHVHEINAALDSDEFTLFFQKIVPLNPRSHEFSIEILTRMHDAQGQLVAPNIFIQAAERYDLMRKIDRWVIRNAVKWISANPRIIDQLEYISINL
ncbi:MAG: diguanylate cyclase, partial [Leptospiraceae bacterium]|nr:diguanylate cyclase [Leptospiraceae bacterium]